MMRIGMEKGGKRILGFVGVLKGGIEWFDMVMLMVVCLGSIRGVLVVSIGNRLIRKEYLSD